MYVLYMCAWERAFVGQWGGCTGSTSLDTELGRCGEVQLHDGNVHHFEREKKERSIICYD
jgi:hypothetical protein